MTKTLETLIISKSITDNRLFLKLGSGLSIQIIRDSFKFSFPYKVDDGGVHFFSKESRTFN